MTKEEWLDKRRAELLPCGYFHFVLGLVLSSANIVLSKYSSILLELSIFWRKWPVKEKIFF